MGSFNGSGVFNRSYSWTSDAANSIPITASRMDTEDTGFAAGLSTCITKDGQQTLTANIPFNNFKAINLGAPTSPNDSATKAYVDAATAAYYVDAGAVNTLTINSGIVGYTVGMLRRVVIAHTNTSSTITLNDNSVGAVQLKMLDGTNPAIGQLVLGYILDCIYNGTNWVVTNIIPTTIGSELIILGGACTTPVAVTFSATAMIVNCALSNVFKTVFTSNVTTAPTLSNPADGQTINWRITQDATGGRTMTWPTSFKWPSAVVQVLSTGINAVDLVVATYMADTGFWYATLTKAFG